MGGAARMCIPGVQTLTHPYTKAGKEIRERRKGREREKEASLA